MTDIESRLASADWESRYVAVRELAGRKGKKVLELLRKASQDRNQSVRCAVAISLGELAGRESVDCLVQLLADPDEWVRLRAVQSLGRLKVPGSVDYIVQYLETEEDVKVRATMVKTIGAYGNEAYLPVLVNYLKDEDPRVRANTIEGLGFIKDPKVQQIVKKFVKDPNARIRANAARVLAGAGHKAAKQTFQEMLASDNQYTRASAVFALGELKDEQYLQMLLRMAGESSFVVRRNIVDALVRYGPAIRRQVEATLGAPDALKRADGAQVLAKIGDRRSLRRLIPLLEDPDGEVRARAEEAIDLIRSRNP
jgi:HEAT repeat protein